MGFFGGKCLVQGFFFFFGFAGEVLGILLLEGF